MKPHVRVRADLEPMSTYLASPLDRISARAKAIENKYFKEYTDPSKRYVDNATKRIFQEAAKRYQRIITW